MPTKSKDPKPLQYTRIRGAIGVVQIQLGPKEGVVTVELTLTPEEAEIFLAALKKAIQHASV